MKWDYYTYLSQPSWFIEAIVLRMRVKSQAVNYLTKKHARQ
jgi:hypothetical protein